MLIDIGSTYFKVANNGKIKHYFRDFTKKIYDDLTDKCDNKLKNYKIHQMIFLR